ncbi:Hypothetical protein FKW44_015553, partial [Caligus rogercresseyi]
MFTSFGSIVFYGIRFNEPFAKWYFKLFLLLPMYSMSVLSRSFSLSVFLKETIHEESSDLFIGITAFLIYVCVNIIAFKSQDRTIFAVSSLVARTTSALGETLVGAGVSRADSPTEDYALESKMLFLPLGFTTPEDSINSPINGVQEDPEEQKDSMRSGLFLLIHNFADVALSFQCHD